MNLKRGILGCLALALLLPLAWCSWPVEEVRHTYGRRVVMGETGERLELYLQERITALGRCKYRYGNPFRVLAVVEWPGTAPEPANAVQVELRERSGRVVARLEVPLTSERTGRSGATEWVYGSERVTLPEEDILMTLTWVGADPRPTVRRWFSVRVETDRWPRFLQCMRYVT